MGLRQVQSILQFDIRGKKYWPDNGRTGVYLYLCGKTELLEDGVELRLVVPVDGPLALTDLLQLVAANLVSYEELVLGDQALPS